MMEFSLRDAVEHFRALVEQVHKFWGYLGLAAGGVIALLSSDAAPQLNRYVLAVAFGAFAAGNGWLVWQGQRDGNQMKRAIRTYCTRRPNSVEAEFLKAISDLPSTAPRVVAGVHLLVDAAVIFAIFLLKPGP